MTKYILKRVGYSIVTLFLLVAITFFMMQLLPGDPFTGEKQLPAAQMEALYAKYGFEPARLNMMRPMEPKAKENVD